MSDYCTNCKWLAKETNANKTKWLCTRQIGFSCLPSQLQSLSGNPKKAIICEEQNWYEVKVKQQEN